MKQLYWIGTKPVKFPGLQKAGEGLRVSIAWSRYGLRFKLEMTSSSRTNRHTLPSKQDYLIIEVAVPHTLDPGFDWSQTSLFLAHEGSMARTWNAELGQWRWRAEKGTAFVKHRKNYALALLVSNGSRDDCMYTLQVSIYTLSVPFFHFSDRSLLCCTLFPYSAKSEFLETIKCGLSLGISFTLHTRAISTSQPCWMAVSEPDPSSHQVSIKKALSQYVW